MSPSAPKKPRKRQYYSPEFKAEAVRLVQSVGQPVKKVAQDLGISAANLHAWVQQANAEKPTDPAETLTNDERAELVRLRRELEITREERDFLKKAAAYFAKDRQ